MHALRREMVKIIGDEGWTITALNNLKLMDSVLKEPQRLKPVNQGKFLLVSSCQRGSLNVIK